ncbi:quinolinate synthase NadA [Clostridium prolinivorans]|uniref:quinolinate synthase NadA n=1 Tax=Clostridium prolinivorans TaxID=2769420 RepID=UPI000FDCD119|nr:quinolinate synthase NadA [Clostridium prolinivorans]
MNLKEEILKLKKEKNALILSHYYQRPEIQDIADAVDDSYNLSKIAKDSTKDIIVFCGVKFMAESAKILSPNKKILLPVMDAGCPMADMADADSLYKLKQKHPNAAVVAYINSKTEVKALCDVCVTSSCAEKVIRNLNNKEIIFLPDKNLGNYIAKKFPDKKFILWDGYCITHQKVKVNQIIDTKSIVPNAKVLVHPECESEVLDLADFIGSTGEIIKYATMSNDTDFIIVTEQGVLHELKKLNPDKKFYVPGTTMTCVNMKKITLEDVYKSLINMNNEIVINEDIRIKAYNSLVKMHELCG